jgi:hypothetical protein
LMVRGVIVGACMGVSVYGPSLLVSTQRNTHPHLRTYMLAATTGLTSLAFMLCAAAVAVKWLVIGRHRPGKYQLYCAYYWRWPLVRSVVSIPQKYVSLRLVPLMGVLCWLLALLMPCSREQPHCAPAQEKEHAARPLLAPAPLN